MLFKRVLDGGRPLKEEDVGHKKRKVICVSEECTSDRSSDACEHCLKIRIIEVMQIVLLSLILWAGITYGGVILPYSTNLIPAGVMYPSPEYDYPFPSPSILKKLPKIKHQHLNESLQFAETSINALKYLETNLERSNIRTDLNTPEHGQWIVGYSSDDVNNIHRLSWTVTKASSFLSHAHCGRFGISEEECASYISTLSLKNTDIGKVCTSFHQTPCIGSKKYRSEDGSCNNLKRTSWGQSLTGFKRILHPRYADGINKPRESKSKKPLPPPRLISSSIATDLNAPDTKHSLAFMQWSQFVEHDLIHVPIQKMIHNKNSISCCNQVGGDLLPRYQHPSCYPLSVSRRDSFYGEHWISCLPYTRSATTFRGDCTFGAAEQMNQATHFLDGSNIYGSNILNAKSLREYNGGLMKVEEHSHGTFLPLIEKSKRKEMCQVGENDDTCFKSGDVRVNVHPHLATMHTIWLREHNRIAKSLSKINPTWSDELLYQEARRIVIAELQHITYEHWLPKLIGKAYDENLEPYDIGYNPEIDPSITNSMATAGMRFVNSLLDGTLNLIDEDGSLNETYELVDHFNRPHIVKSPGKFDKLVRGLISQRSQSLDLHFADDVTQQLYSPRGQKLGLDILSFDIQRGRDHGIPPYYLFREFCNLNPGNDFEDFQDTIPEKNIEQLKRLYNHAHDVDLIVGALAEQPENGMFLGPVLTCLLREQFHRTRSGDRYFYTNIEQPVPFTHQQLEQIRKTSLSRIICDNVPEILEIPKNVFEISKSRYDYVSCNGNDIKRVNLAAWQDPAHKPNILTRTKKIITTSF